MSDFTFATIIIAAKDQASAQTELGFGFFTVPLSIDGELPATNYMSSGPFQTEEFNKINEEVTWTSKVYLGQDWQAALDSERLVLISNPSIGV